MMKTLIDIREEDDAEPDPIFESTFSSSSSEHYSIEEGDENVVVGDPIFECSSSGTERDVEEYQDIVSWKRAPSKRKKRQQQQPPTKLFCFQNVKQHYLMVDSSAETQPFIPENNNKTPKVGSLSSDEARENSPTAQVPEDRCCRETSNKENEEQREDVETTPTPMPPSDSYKGQAFAVKSSEANHDNVSSREYPPNTKEDATFQEGECPRIDQEWHCLLAFLSKYLEVLLQISETLIKSPPKTFRFPLLLPASTHSISCSSSSRDHQSLALIPFNLPRTVYSHAFWQPSQEIQHAIHLLYIIAMKCLVQRAQQQNQIQQQKRFLKQLLHALKLYSKTNNDDDIQMELANTLESLARLHHDHLQDYNQAFVYYTRSLEIKSALYGGSSEESNSNIDLANSLETIGILARDKLSNTEVAIRCLKQALDMKYQVFFYDRDPLAVPQQHQKHYDRDFSAEEYANVAQTLHNLGLAYDKGDQYEDAHTYYEKSLAMKKIQQRAWGMDDNIIMEELKGDDQNSSSNKNNDHHLLVATLFNLGCVCEKLDHLEESRSYLEEALQMQYTSEEKEDQEIGLKGTLLQIGWVYEKLQEIEGAYQYYKIALDIHYQQQQQQQISSELNKPPHDRLFAKMLYGAARVSNQLGYYEESLFAYESLYEVLVGKMDGESELKGKEKQLLVRTVYHLGLLNDIFGRIQEARTYYRVWLSMLENTNRSPQAPMVRMNILCLQCDLFPYKKAPNNRRKKQPFVEALDLYCQLLQTKYQQQDNLRQDAALAIIVRNVAVLSARYARRFNDARTYYEQYLDIVWYSCQQKSDKNVYHNMLQNRYLVTAQVMHDLGTVERKLRSYDSAKYYQMKAVEHVSHLRKPKKDSQELRKGQMQNLDSLQTAIERELGLLNSRMGCGWLLWLWN